MSEPALPLRRPGRLMALLCLAALAACSGDADKRLVTYATWRQAVPAPQPHVERVPVSHAVRFAPLSQQVAEIEDEALLRFLTQSRVRPGDTVVLSAGPPQAGQPDLSAARIAALRATLARSGIAANVAYGGVPGLAGDEVLVTARTLVVVAPDCPGYNTPITFDLEGRPNLSVGCANNANLGLMVANPADLVEGRTLTPADGEAAVLSIQRYRAGEVWPTADPSTNVPFRVNTEEK